MAIREIVTRGYGNGTFNGTIAFAVMAGYVAAIVTYTGTGALVSKLAALFGMGNVSHSSLVLTPDLTPSLDSTTDLHMGNVPDIDNPKTYEAVLGVQEAVEALLQKQDEVNADIEDRVTTLEP